MLGRLLEQSALTHALRDAMFELLCTHFAGVSREVFEHDLSKKNWVVLIEQEDRLQGFSTLRVFETVCAGAVMTVVCSGDTIVSPTARGSAAFPRAWITSVYRLRDRYPQGRLVWLLLTSGFRTYRFLPVFWSEFYPRASSATPSYWQRLLEQLATAEYGEQFDPQSGIVRFATPQRLKDPLGGVSAGRIVDPDVSFFLQRNPGHAAGDELVCIADLDPSNLSPAGRRVVFGGTR
jgi:hypothetical protein